MFESIMYTRVDKFIVTENNALPKYYISSRIWLNFHY